MQAVFDHSASQHSARLVLLAVADACDHEGTGCWLGKERIAEMANVDRGTVTRSIVTLCEMGELAVEPRAGRTNLYRILLPVDNAERGRRMRRVEGAQVAPPGAQDAPTPRGEMRPDPYVPVNYPLGPDAEVVVHGVDESARLAAARAALDEARAVLAAKSRHPSQLFNGADPDPEEPR